MDRLSLNAEERAILGKKVKRLRKDGILPGHVFGKGLETEHVSVNTKDFLHTFSMAGETGLIDLKIGSEKIRPVLVREVTNDPVTGTPVHIDFYQVNLTQKVKVPVPLVLIGEELELVKNGEAIILQTLNEIEAEALPTDLVEKIEVDTSTLKNMDDAITVGQLNFDRNKLTIGIDDETIVVKLAPAVSAEMEALLEEQAAETAETVAEAEVVEGGEAGATEAEANAGGGVSSEVEETAVHGEPESTENSSPEGRKKD